MMDYTPQTFGSYFRGMGTITKYDLDTIIYDTFDYFLNDKYLGMDPNNLSIRINKNDKELMKAITNIDKNVKREINTEPIECYKHIYSMDKQGITGRNLNIAMRKGNTNLFHDCAAITIMESPYKKIAIDMAVGNNTLSMCYFNEKSTVAASRIADIIKINNIEKMKFADLLIAVGTLLHEDIASHSSRDMRKK